MEEKNSNNEQELVIHRTFNAPQSVVWKAWTEPEQLKKWWGPKGMPITVHALEFRPGGMFHYSMQSADGKVWWGKFKYHEIVPMERIVFVVSFSNSSGGITRNPISSEWPLEVHNALILSEHDGKTTITLRGRPINATTEESKVFYDNVKNVQQGFKGTMDQLDEYLNDVNNQ